MEEEKRIDNQSNQESWKEMKDTTIVPDKMDKQFYQAYLEDQKVESSETDLETKEKAVQSHSDENSITPVISSIKSESTPTEKEDSKSNPKSLEQEENEVIDYFKFDFSTNNQATIKKDSNEEETPVSENKKSQEEKPIDFFQYDFSANNPSTNLNKDSSISLPSQIKKDSETEELVSNLTTSYSFENVMRPTEVKECPIQPTEQFDMSHLLETKDRTKEKKKDKVNTPIPKKKEENSILKHSVIFFYLFFIVFAIFGIYTLIQKNKQFNLAREEITLAIESSYQVEVIAKKKVQSNDLYEWISQDPEIASVDEHGLITANKMGTTVIEVTSKKSKIKKKIQVTAIDIVIQNIHFSASTMTMNPGEEITIYPIINDDESIIANLDWISWDESIVQVNNQGKVKAIQCGKVKIAVQDPKTGTMATLEIEVKEKEKPKESNSVSPSSSNTSKPSNNSKPSNQKPSSSNSNSSTNSNTNSNTNTIPVQSITLNHLEITLEVDKTQMLQASIEPTNATDQAIVWTSSNDEIATVKDGLITAISPGTTVIRATTNNGLVATCTVTVLENEPQEPDVEDPETPEEKPKPPEEPLPPDNQDIEEQEENN